MSTTRAEICAVACAELFRDAGEIMVPFIKRFVPVVDIEKGEVQVTPPGGLFETLENDDKPGAEQGIPAAIEGLSEVVDEA